MKAEAEIVVLKIFIAPRNSLCELAEEARIESKWDIFTHKDSSEECSKVLTLEICTETDEFSDGA